MDKPILKLPDSTIKLIAAGEVITRPLNIIKELLENSIDAGGSHIRIIIEQGGVKLIEITDDGHGIARTNSKLLCQRYATSKLKTADDLTRLSTFGFRGEALSSISEMADIEVISFNETIDKIGWQAAYRHGKIDGTLIDKICPHVGTTIRVKNLFSNVLPRKNAMVASFADEKKAIVDLVMRMAIHHRNKVTLSLCEKTSSGLTDLICFLAPTDIRPCIGSFYGMDMENNLFDFEATNDQHYEAKLYVAFSYKKSSSNIHHSHTILFVNDRLVECDELRREIGALVLEYLSAKQFTSMLYISLTVPPCDLDVNIHPAKASVSMHYQQEIIALILTEMRARFQTNLMTQVVPTKISQQRNIGELMKHSTASQAGARQNLNLTAAGEQRLALLAPGCFSQASSPQNGLPVHSAKRPYEQVHVDPNQPNLTQLKIPPSRVRCDHKLRSIYELRELVAQEQSKENMKTIRNSVFVGLFDHHQALIQYDTKLFAINLKAFLKEQCYQFFLFDFGNFPPIEILPPGNKTQFIIEVYLNDIRKYEPENFASLANATAQSVIDVLMNHSKILEDYLSLRLTRNEIITIPCLIPDHIPNLVYLGKFLVELANKVDYTEERECFHKMGRVVADFYSEPPANLKDMATHRRYHEILDSTLYEAIKRYLFAPEWLFTKENICQISDTKDLYKVFERC